MATVGEWGRAIGSVAALLAAAAPVPTSALAAAPPRLIVVVAVDQLGRDLVERFAPLFPPGGFRRLLENGADYTSCHHRHFLTLTGPGHAVMLTGAYPVRTGVVANRWYSRREKKMVNCVEDERFPGLEPGSTAEEKGFSPRYLSTSTVGDALRASTGSRAKVFSLALKDRSAILMGGRRPTGAIWLDEGSCHFTTSSYYADRLPAWVAAVNAAEPCAAYAGKQWTRLRTDLDYEKLADVDDAPYEQDVYGLGRVFPHPLKQAEIGTPSRHAAVISSPFGNELLLGLAKAALEKEALGRDDVPDLLALGFSSNDYVGHLYGPNSQEVLDVTLRTDRLLAELMAELDRVVGEGRWTIAIVSDHGVAPVPEYLEKMRKLPERKDHYRWRTDEARPRVERALSRHIFGKDSSPAGFPGFFEAWDDGTSPFVWMNRSAVERLPKVSFDELLALVRAEIESIEGVQRVYTSAERDALSASRDALEQSVSRTWHRDNGGDLIVQLRPHWFPGFRAATTHGSPYPYDTHVPMLLYGAGVHQGRFTRPVAVVDLASTLSILLGIQPPPEDQGAPLHEALGIPRGVVPG